MAIHGFLIIPGDGLASIMAAGLMTTTMAGYGFPAPIGARPGFAGGMARGIMAGRL